MHIWRITEDEICGGDDTGVKGPRGYDEIKKRLDALPEDKKETIRFRMLDDDGEIYYLGTMTTDDPGGECLLAPLDDFGMPNAGCTSIQIHKSGKWVTV